jgi:hypothetical protein
LGWRVRVFFGEKIMRKIVLTIEVLEDNLAEDVATELRTVALDAVESVTCIGKITVDVQESEAKQLTEAYYSLYPKESPEITLTNNPGMDRESVWDSATQTYQNWLDRLHENPQKALATTNWCGKVTKAYFKMIGVPLPKRKDQMMEVVKNRLGI